METESDFSLLELTDSIPARYHAYYAGWSRVTTAPQQTISIHHPKGDVKKISYDSSSATTSKVYSTEGKGGYTHWRVVYYPGRGTGIVEHGSSGAPLFDQSGRVVGQHSWDSVGVSVNCNDITQEMPATFGKFALAWDTYGSTDADKLKPWLDPDNTGALVLNGLDPSPLCCVGVRGNADNDPAEIVDIGDVTALVSYLFMSGTPPECWEEGNADGDVDELIDISDLTRLIDYLFISQDPLASCP